MKRVTGIILLVIILGLVGIMFLRSSSTSIPWGTEKQKEYAHTLFNQGLYQQAVAEYEKLISSSGLSNRERANLCYLVANIYMDSLHDYESALAGYLKVKVLDPKTGLENEITPREIECLERLGKSLQAQREMDKRVSLKPTAVLKSGDVVAKIGKREITWRELQEEIENLPPYIQKEYKEPAKKLEFLKNYLASELLYDSARRRNLDKDTEILKKSDQIKKSLMVQKLILEETRDKVTVTPTEVQLYYEAHKKDFAQEKKSEEEIKTTIQQIIYSQKQQSATQQILEKAMEAEKVKIYEELFK